MPAPDASVSDVLDFDWQAALKGRRVLVTGHTGFKGGWLALWLRQLGAEVVGVALPPPPGPSFYECVGLKEVVDDRVGDIRSSQSFERAIAGVDAELVIHMAAQSLVRQSYVTPVDTYLTNVVGTAVVLDAARKMPSLRSAIVVTSDKCYENNEWVWGYRETDRMGGSDPYSSSKGCAELVVSAYRRSYFAQPGGPQLASVRAGNVFGGGDWAVDRLVPDIVRAVMAGAPVVIRNPRSIRPWQHVLEPLSGYLTLAARMIADGPRYAQAWNFGPDPDGVIDVETLACEIQRSWGAGGPELSLARTSQGPHEAGILKLDSTKAKTLLGWQPRLRIGEAIQVTVEWYRSYAAGNRALRALSEEQIRQYSGARRCV
jgi:CDP-glucose 4,6-dehydratase